MTTDKPTQPGIITRIRSVIAAIVGFIVLIGAALLGFLPESSTSDSLVTPNVVSRPSGDLPGALAPPARPEGILPGIASPSRPSGLERWTLVQGFGGQKDFWTVYFNNPRGESDPNTYIDSIDTPLSQAIDMLQVSLDIAAFEFNNPLLTQAVINAHRRGVRVRIVTDNEFGLEETDESIPQFIAAGIPVVDDDRSALMHNKFMILDNHTVWTGSWNYTVNGTYRNNNNALVVRSPQVVQVYQIEFNEMFERREFGARSTAGAVALVQDHVPITILFAPEDDTISRIVQTIHQAQKHVYFLAFSFTLDAIGEAMLTKAASGVTVQGIFEKRGSTTQYSELARLWCAGLDVRQDGNRYSLHHKIIIVDDMVLTGSFNFSKNATENNDENIIIIQDRDLAQLYLEEYDRLWASATLPDTDKVTC